MISYYFTVFTSYFEITFGFLTFTHTNPTIMYYIVSIEHIFNTFKQYSNNYILVKTY